MDTIDSLTDKINNRIKDTPIFFVTNDAERALGLEKLLNNYHIICIDDNAIIDYMQKENVKVFCLEKELGELNTIFRNSNRLLNHKLTQKYIKQNSQGNKGHLMFFKIAPNLARSAEKLGFKMLNTTAELNQKFELKIPQYEAIKDLDIRLPKTEILKLTEAKYKELVKRLGNNFVLQFNRGHTGGGTVIIYNERELEDLKKQFPQRQARFATQIYGHPYTLNACVTKHGICWGGLSYQITGVEECTSKKAGTVGNDWAYPKELSKKVKGDFDKFTRVIGEEMTKFGFCGMFGLDIVVDKKNDEAYMIEINARQPASIPMFTKLQIKEGQIPLSMLAIAEFLNIDYEINIEKYNKKASSSFEAAQLFIRNKFEHKGKLIGGIKPGVYRLRGDNSALDWKGGKPKLKPNVIIIDEDRDMPLVFEGDAYAIDGILEGGMLFLCVKEGKIVSSNNEVARIQAQQTLITKNAELQPFVKEIIKGLNKYIVLREITNENNPP